MDLDDLLFRTLTGRARAEDEAEFSQAPVPAREGRRRLLSTLLSLAARADASRSDATPPTVDEILERGHAGGLVLDARRAAPTATPRSRRVRKLVPWAAVVAGVIAASFLWRASFSALGFGVQEVTTGEGETATVVLVDGTVVRLGPGSRLRTDRVGNTREVTFSGRAYFAVASDPREPFRVHTPSGQVRVLGTRFDLDTSGLDLRVIVVEGTVVIEVEGQAQEVQAGQVGRVVRATAYPPEPVNDPAATIEWMGRFLAFQSTPLREAALEIERLYGVELEVNDPALAARTVTSHFADWSLGDLVDALCLIVHATCSIEENVVRMEPR